MKKTLFIFFSFIGFSSFSQNITVIDAITRQPVTGVAVYSKNPEVSVVTNLKGQASLLAFTGADSIFFQHVSYDPVVVSFATLKSSFYVMALNESSISLDEVVIAANRWEEQKLEIPYRVVKINMKEAGFQNPQTSADLLNSGGYVYIQKSQLAGGSPMLRGFSTNRVLLVVDGVRMNNAIFRLGNVQNVISLDAGSTESAEVLFGPGAVIYGSDAIGGVMDFHTLKPSMSESDKPVLTGNASVRYSTANREKAGHFDLNVGFRKWAFLTSITAAGYEDLRAGSHGNSFFLRPVYQDYIGGRDTILVNDDPQLQVRSGFNQFYLMQKIEFRPSNDWNYDYSFHYSTTSNAPRYDRLTLDGNGDGILDNAEWYYGPQQWIMNRLGITRSGESRLFDRLHVVAALQNYEESRHDRKFNNKRLLNQVEKVDALSLNADLDRKITEKVTLFYGAEAVYNRVGSEASRIHIETNEVKATNTRYPDGSTWQAYGAYANLKFKIDPAWILNTGLRYSFYKVKAAFDTAMFPFPFTRADNANGALNGSLGLVFKPFENWQLFCNGSTGFHAPNIDDIGKVFDSEPGSVVVPNPDLKPEYAWNAEVGSAGVLGHFLKADVSFYYTYLDNALARRDFQYNGKDSLLYDGIISGVQAVQNITRAYVWGVQAGIDMRFRHGIGLKSTLNYQKGKEQDEASLEDYPLRHAAPLFGSTHLTFERKNFRLDLYTVYNGKMAFEDLALSERQDNASYARDDNGNPFVPSWYTLNLKTAWYVNRFLVLNAGIENITDRLYRPYASGISAPGRNFMVAVKARF